MMTILLFAEITRYLKPGGWLELQQYETYIQQDRKRRGKKRKGRDRNHANSLLTWFEDLNKVADEFGRPTSMASSFEKILAGAGFLTKWEG